MKTRDFYVYIYTRKKSLVFIQIIVQITVGFVNLTEVPSQSYLMKHVLERACCLNTYIFLHTDYKMVIPYRMHLHILIWRNLIGEASNFLDDALLTIINFYEFLFPFIPAAFYLLMV